MRSLAVGLVVGLLVPACPARAAENPCTNGSFETLSQGGFPADWEPVGQTVEVATGKDARTGKRALRMVRAADAKSPETGLNRAWKAHSGQRGAMIDRLRGGIDFWYKAVSADAAQLRIYAIPMTAEPIEKTKSPRATFIVPPAQVGDGQPAVRLHRR